MTFSGSAFLVLLLVTAKDPSAPISEPLHPEARLVIDEALGGRSRPFVRYPGTVSFGPTGRRLWVNYLDEVPGFTGRIDFIQRLNIPALFSINVLSGSEEVDWDSQEHAWYPSHLAMTFQRGGMILRESKFISWDDVAIDEIELENIGPEPVTLKISVPSDFDERVRDVAMDRLGCPLTMDFGVRVLSDKETPGEGEFEWRVNAGQSLHLIAAAAVGLKDEEEEDLRERSEMWLARDEPSVDQGDEYQDWFDGATAFVCNDPFVNRMWAYRWYLLRRNLSDPAMGNLPYPFYLEGRGHKMSNEPYNPHGWEFSKLIPFSSPFHLLEGRWHRDVSACTGEIDDLIANRSSDGLFQYATVKQSGSYYANFIPWAVHQLVCARPEVEVSRAQVEALKENVRAWFRLFDPDGDSLPHITNHNRTGKEYQPSYFYFDDFPEDARGAKKAVLERVDVASYQYMNAVALSRLCRMAGDPDGEREFAELAQKIRSAVLEKMWDPETKFFYDIREHDDARAMVKNVVGFDPFFAGIATQDHLPAFAHLGDPGEFWTPWPVPSVSIDCPAFAPDASWFGDHIKGPHGAVWNGPTWPFTDSTVLMGLANATRTDGHRLDRTWSELFRKYTRLQFRGHDIDFPMVVEHYNPLTGEEISQEEDYFHSSWIDLVVTGVVGLVPSDEDVLRLDPIDCGMKFFHLRGLPWRGREVDVSWIAPGLSRKEGQVPPGFTVWIDGELVENRDQLGLVEIDVRR